jgi:hypothetical protein
MTTRQSPAADSLLGNGATRPSGKLAPRSQGEAWPISLPGIYIPDTNPVVGFALIVTKKTKMELVSLTNVLQ